MKYEVVNPATGQLEREFPTATDAEISEGWPGAQRGYSSWRHTSKAERAGTCCAGSPSCTGTAPVT